MSESVAQKVCDTLRQHNVENIIPCFYIYFGSRDERNTHKIVNKCAVLFCPYR